MSRQRVHAVTITESCPDPVSGRAVGVEDYSHGNNAIGRDGLLRKFKKALGTRLEERGGSVTPQSGTQGKE